MMLPINPSQIPKLYQEALALQNAGKTAAALKQYKVILQAKSDIAEVHFQIGQIQMKALEINSAVDAFAKAAALKPQVGAIWQGYAEALLRLDDAKKTAAALRQLETSGLPEAARKSVATKLANRAGTTAVEIGDVKPSHLQRIVALLNAGKTQEAETQIRSLIRKHPNVAILHNMLGTTLRQKGETDPAETAFRKAIALDRNYAEAYSNYGALLVDSGRAADALDQLEKARTLIPKSSVVLGNIAKAYIELNRHRAALELLDRSIKIDPKNPLSFRRRAQVHTKNANHQEALDDLKKSLALGFKNASVYQLIATSLAALGDNDAALVAANKSIALKPKDAKGYATKAGILQSLGDFEGAEKIFLSACEIDPTNGSIYRTLSASHKFQVDDPLLQRMETAWERKDLSQDDRRHLGFALSKAMEDIKAHDRVFAYLSEANRLTREKYSYDIAIRRDEVDRIKVAFEDFDPKEKPATIDNDYAPIFVTGMPRSGTTLIEQILASHSTVTGAGETGRFARQGYALMLPASGDKKVSEIKQPELTELARDYKEYIQKLLPGSDRITDKSIQTYLVMGLVWLSMPKARVIVVRRDPRDNLLSVYKNVFPEGTHLYSYDLTDLGTYYRMFVEVIDFWKQIAPDKFYEIWYDDLIANPEEESRKLVAAAGLEWEDACLNFHENKRRVDTLSVYQVRQPIYKTSLKAWQRYEKELKPLFDSLGDALPID